MTINLRAVRVFMAVVEHGSFTVAARALEVSQPAVSRTVADLESSVGLPLLERGPRGAEPTEAGRSLYRRGRSIFAEERAAEHELRALSGLEHGTLRVGASTTIANYLLPPLFAAFHRRYPGIDLHLRSANTRTIAELLSEYHLDVALVEGPVQLPGLESNQWCTDKLVLFAAPGHPLADRGQIIAEELEDYVFLMRERGSGTRAVIEAALANRDVELRRRMEMENSELIRQSVAAGLGVAILSRAVIEEQVALGKVKIVAMRDLVLERSLAWLRVEGRPAGPAGKAFEDMIGEHAPSS